MSVRLWPAHLPRRAGWRPLVSGAKGQIDGFTHKGEKFFCIKVKSGDTVLRLIEGKSCWNSASIFNSLKIS